MASLLSTPTRSAPLQERSSRRIAHLLEVAAELIAEVGYEAMTMTAVAERSGASIGALYRWFPDKTSIALALRNQYSTELRGGWVSFMQSARALSVPEFAEALIDHMVDFCREHPAYLPLLASPVQVARDPAARKAIRDQFVELFQAYNPEISDERALLIANVSLQIVRGLIALYADSDGVERAALTREVKIVLGLYLSESLTSTR